MESKSKDKLPYFMTANRYIYIRIGPAKVQELKQDRPLSKEEARAICRQVSPTETIAYVLGGIYTFAQCVNVGIESSMKLAQMIEEIMLKAIIMGIRPRARDRRSWLTYKAWAVYFKEKGLIKTA